MTLGAQQGRTLALDAQTLSEIVRGERHEQTGALLEQEARRDVGALAPQPVGAPVDGGRRRGVTAQSANTRQAM